MSSLDQQELFASGPHWIRPGSWERSVQRRSFAGLDGELSLDMGLRSRQLHQDGRLQAESVEAIHALIDQIEQFIDGDLHALVDNHGRTFANVMMEKFEPVTPVRRGRRFYCQYTICYRQLP